MDNIESSFLSSPVELFPIFLIWGRGREILVFLEVRIRLKMVLLFFTFTLLNSNPLSLKGVLPLLGLSSLVVFGTAYTIVNLLPGYMLLP